MMIFKHEIMMLAEKALNAEDEEFGNGDNTRVDDGSSKEEASTGMSKKGFEKK